MLRKLVAVAAFALAVPIAAPAAAQAQGLNEIILIDQAGDMWRLPDRGRPLPASHQPRGDIRRTTIRHGQHAITVRTRFRELSRRPSFYGLVVRLRTSAGVRRTATLTAGQFGRRAFWRGILQVERPNGTPVDCGPTHHINYTTNVIRLRIPRACVNSPRWVQANVLLLGAYGRPARVVEFFDTAHNARHRINDWSPRLHRP